MKKRWISFILVIVLLPVLAIYSAITGSIEITAIELIQGLISGEDNRVDIIKDLRFPRIIIALFAGAMLSVSGVLLQSVMRNPLAEPGIIGISSGAGFVHIICISSGAGFVTIIVLFFFPALYFYASLFAFIGGAIAFLLVFSLSWKSGLNPLRMILIGVAVNAVFVSLSQLFSQGGNSVVSA